MTAGRFSAGRKLKPGRKLKVILAAVSALVIQRCVSVVTAIDDNPLAQVARHYMDEGFVSGVSVHHESSATHRRWLQEFDAFLLGELGPNPTDTTEPVRRSGAQQQEKEGWTQTWASERHWDTPLFWEMGTDPGVLDVAEALLGGPDLLLFSTFIFCKFGKGTPVPVHQDVVYWDMEPPEAVSIWYALDKMTVGNGPIWVENRTHITAATNPETTRPTEPPEHQKHYISSLQPGEIFANHGLLIHGSAANTQEGVRRCGISLRYTRTSTRHK